MEIFKKIIKTIGIILFSLVLIIIVGTSLFFLVKEIMKQPLITFLSTIALVIVFIVLPYFAKKKYKKIDNYISTNDTITIVNNVNDNTTKENDANDTITIVNNVNDNTTKENDANDTITIVNNTNDTSDTNDTNEVTTSKKNTRIDKISRFIYNLKKNSTNNKKDTESIKLLIKKLDIYVTLLASYFCTLFLYRFINKFLDYLRTPSPAGETTGNPSRTYLDYTIYFGTILTIFVIIAIIQILIEYAVNYTNYWYVVIYILAILGIAITVKVFWVWEDVSILHSIHIFLLYLGTLPINYICICSIKKLYSWLHNDKNDLDPAKLTLLWTIIVFILGVAFNIKP